MKKDSVIEKTLNRRLWIRIDIFLTNKAANWLVNPLLTYFLLGSWAGSSFTVCWIGSDYRSILDHYWVFWKSLWSTTARWLFPPLKCVCSSKYAEDVREFVYCKWGVFFNRLNPNSHSYTDVHENFIGARIIFYSLCKMTSKSFNVVWKWKVVMRPMFLF